MAAVEQNESNRIDVERLICPYQFAVFQREVPLVSTGPHELRAGRYSYPVVEGIPDLRLPADREGTSYDDLLPEFIQDDGAAPEKILAPYGLNPEDIAGKSVLIAGAATGKEMTRLLPLGPGILHVLDFSIYVRELAKGSNDHRLRFTCGDVCHLPFKRSSFDLVLSAGVIQHTRSPEIAVREMVRCLKPGGIVSIGNSYPPNLHNRRVTIDRLRGMYHQMERSVAKKIVARQARLCLFLVSTGLWRVHRRFRIPGILEFSNTPGKNLVFYYANLLDYYLPRYRHMISYDEMKSWAASIGAETVRTPKGIILRKPGDFPA